MEAGNNLPPEQPDFTPETGFGLTEISLRDTHPGDRIVLDTARRLSYYLQIEEVIYDEEDPFSSFVRAQSVKVDESHNWQWDTKLPLGIESSEVEFRGSFEPIPPRYTNEPRRVKPSAKFSLALGEKLEYAEVIDETLGTPWLSPKITRIGFIPIRVLPLEEIPKSDKDNLSGGN